MALTAEEFARYIVAARARALAGQTATAAQIRSIYRRAADDVAREILRAVPAGILSARHLEPIMDALDEAARTVSQDVLSATLRGIDLTTAAALSPAEKIAVGMLGGVFQAGGMRAVYHAINRRAVLAFATRTRFDGLRLSDRVWRLGPRWRTGVTRTLETAVARGQAARDVAKDLRRFLRPGPVQPHQLATRRRLGIGRNIDYRAMRIARTEMGMAFKEGTIIGHQAAPSYQGIRWSLSDSHPITDVCDDYAEGGPNGDGVYPAGQEPSQPHPQCLCNVSAAHEDPDAFAARLGEWLDEPGSHPDLEQWYQEVATPMFLARPVPVGSEAIAVPAQTRTGPHGMPVVPAVRDAAKAEGVEAELERTWDDVADRLRRAVGLSRYEDARRMAREAEEEAERRLADLELPGHRFRREAVG